MPAYEERQSERCFLMFVQPDSTRTALCLMPQVWGNQKLERSGDAQQRADSWHSRVYIPWSRVPQPNNFTFASQYRGSMVPAFACNTFLHILAVHSARAQRSRPVLIRSVILETGLFTRTQRLAPFFTQWISYLHDALSVVPLGDGRY